MENYLNCKRIDTAISRAKRMLTEKAKQNGLYENFGQDEVRKIKDKFIDCTDYSNGMNSNRNKVLAFECWCEEYSY